MIKMTTCTIIWLVGSVAVYRRCKRAVVASEKAWTRGNRWFVIYISFYSWIFFLAEFLMSLTENDKPAKW